MAASTRRSCLVIGDRHEVHAAPLRERVDLPLGGRRALGRPSARCTPQAGCLRGGRVAVQVDRLPFVFMVRDSPANGRVSLSDRQNWVTSLLPCARVTGGQGSCDHRRRPGHRPRDGRGSGARGSQGCHWRPRRRARSADGVKLGQGVRAYHVDVVEKDSFAEFIDSVERDLGPLDVLVNNAGIMLVGWPFADEDDATTRRMIDVNLHGVLNGTKIALQRMRLRGSGHIVNISSQAEMAAFRRRHLLRDQVRGARVQRGGSQRCVSRSCRSRSRA